MTDPVGGLLPLLFLLAILPVVVVLGTCFLKIAIVFGMLRSALGVQQVPPAIALHGLALILTVFVMAPVGMAVRDEAAAHRQTPLMAAFWQDAPAGALGPYRAFLARHAEARSTAFFRRMAVRLWPPALQAQLGDSSLFLLLPAFAIGQLAEAFRIGLLLYLPFLAIDLLVSSILLAMGMMMVSPLTVALPFKLLVFVLMDGWEKLIGALMTGYAP